MAHHEKPVVLDGYSLTLRDAEEIAFGRKVTISVSAGRRIGESREFVRELAAGESPVYGLNTGFGYFAKSRIEKPRLKELQHNILRSHAAGYGSPFSIPETRLALALRLNLFIKGISGVRLELCAALCNFLEHEIYPVVPEFGSLGASGDLIPLAHLALPLIGEGIVRFRGKEMSAKRALARVGLKPLSLAEKEGLALVNGTEFMQAVGGLALCEALRVMDLADRVAAVSFEGMEGLVAALDPLVHKARGQRGQIESARIILAELKGSPLHRTPLSHSRVQDPYSLRCAPQIHGASRDALGFAAEILHRELSAVTDNPLIFADKKRAISGGNFHGQPLALAFDFAAIASAELGSVSERRLELLCNPHQSNLPAFLSKEGGIHSGYMALQYLSASLVNENKMLAVPSSTDSIPGNVGVEDHVSMGMTSARKLRQVVKNVKTTLAIELLAAAQAIDKRGVTRLGEGTRLTYRRLRERIPFVDGDRILAPEIEAAVGVINELGETPGL